MVFETYDISEISVLSRVSEILLVSKVKTLRSSFFFLFFLIFRTKAREEPLFFLQIKKKRIYVLGFFDQQLVVVLACETLAREHQLVVHALLLPVGDEDSLAQSGKQTDGPAGCFSTQQVNASTANNVSGRTSIYNQAHTYGLKVKARLNFRWRDADVTRACARQLYQIIYLNMCLFC